MSLLHLTVAEQIALSAVLLVLAPILLTLALWAGSRSGARVKGSRRRR